MGVVLDASPVIIAERKGQTAPAFLRSVLSIVGDQEVVLSAISYTELVHGLHRVKPGSKLDRSFLADLILLISIEPYAREAAEIAGRIDAEQRMRGYVIPFSDLLIGATALHLGYSVLTTNLRHFRLIPNLQVIPL